MADHLLVMCTANQCRSPIAAALLVRRATRHRLDIEIRSCGELAAGLAASPGTIRAMKKEEGIDLSTHRSTRLTPELLEWADLVVTMERRHLHHIATIDVDAVHRTFPLRELTRIAPRRAPGQTIEDWARLCDANRDPATVLSASKKDDVADPMGLNRRAHRRCIAELNELTDALLDTIATGPHS